MVDPSVWFFFAVCLSLGWIGGLPVIFPFYEIGQILTFLYYFLLLCIFPLCGFIERIIYIWYVTVHSRKAKSSVNSKKLIMFYEIFLLLLIESYIFCIWNIYTFKRFLYLIFFWDFIKVHIKEVSINTIIYIIFTIYNTIKNIINFFIEEINISVNLLIFAFYNIIDIISFIIDKRGINLNI